MKLALTKKYVEELQQEYCDPNKTYIPGYGVNSIYFAFIAPQPRIMFLGEDEFIVLELGKMSLNVKDHYTIPIDAQTAIEFKKGITANRLKISRGGNVIFKTVINKVLLGFGDIQSKFNEALGKFAR